jgi:hypothetical protein
MSTDNTVFVTFGQIHVHSVNGKTFDKNCVAAIKCKDRAHGIELAFEYFGGTFHNTYLNEDMSPELLKYYPRGIIDV